MKPKAIMNIYDNNGETCDRYTIVLRSSGLMCDMLGLSELPDSPLGFSQYTMGMDGEHLGKRIQWNDLPENVQSHVEGRLKYYE